MSADHSRHATRYHGRPVPPSNAARAAILASLALMSLNYALTARWADIPGSLHGPKRWVFLPLLLLTIVLSLWTRPRNRAPLGSLATIAGAGAVLALAGVFFVWFPPAVWTQIPFLDNWPARYVSTMQGIELLSRGAVVGWDWQYLGGYHVSSDITQSHMLLALLPVAIAGPAIGFHLLHLVLFLSLPAIVFWDLAAEDRDTRFLAMGLSAAIAAGFSYLLLRSGDTNSLAGTACTLLTLAASGAAARGVRLGAPLLVCSLALLNYVHAGFLMYAAFFLLVEAAFYRDRARLIRAVVAIACAFVAGLPVFWESWRYRDFFLPNNVIFDPHPRFAWGPFLRTVYYNVELLWLPGRWFNDFTGLALVCVPITVYVAWRGAAARSRAGLYAWLALATIALMRLNAPEFAYVFRRPIYLLGMCMAPVLAAFASKYAPTRALAASFVALVVAYLQLHVFHVPHVPSPRDAAPAVVDRLRSLDGALVLVENTPHRDMDADPVGVTEPSPFDAHVEQLFATASGRRLYAGFWDGWQWSPYRDQVLAGGAFRGRALGRVAPADLVRELDKWGVRHLLVWSDASLTYLRAHPETFSERWTSGRWHQFERHGADTRDVATATGSGRLAAYDPLGARIELSDVRAGSPVVVRTNYHPSWTAHVEGSDEAVTLSNVDGQLGFGAPRDGTYAVALVYPRRLWLTVVALLAVGLTCASVYATAARQRVPTS